MSGVYPRILTSERLTTYSTTPTATGTTTLSLTSNFLQYFTGTLTQTIVLPVVTTLYLGFQFKIINKSTGTLTVNSSGGNLVSTISANCSALYTCVLLTGTNASSWKVEETMVSTVASGEKIVSVTSGGTQTNYDVVNSIVSAVALDALSESAWSTGVATSPGIQGQSAYGTSYFYQCVGANSWFRISIVDTRLNLYLTPDFDDSITQGTTVLLDAAYPTAVIGQRVWGTNRNVYEKKNTNLWKKTSINFTNMDFLPQYVIQSGVTSGATINILSTFDISSIVVEALTTTAGNIYIGSTIGNNDVVNTTSLPITIGTKKQLNYLVNPNYPQSSPRNIYVGISSAASVNLHMVQQKLFI